MSKLKLSDALRQYVAGWRDDVPPEWRSLLDGVEPDLDAVPEHLDLGPGELIFPLRKSHGDPRAPAGSHVFHALDGLPPADVRVLLLGQDPYPRLSRATGRAFEQGDLSGWDDAHVAESLRRIVQTLAQFRQADPGYRAHDDYWPSTLARLRVGQPAIEAPRALFDRWTAQGVLCLNTGLTFSRFDPYGTPRQARVQPAHVALWAPVVTALLRGLARRPGQGLLLLLWGDVARQSVAAMKLTEAALAAGNGARVVTVRRVHPGHDGPEHDKGASPFLALPDPFSEANLALVQAGMEPIDW